MRLRIGKELDLINNDEFKFLWVVDFPMFTYDEEEGRYKAEHHHSLLSKQKIWNLS